ncbi:DgyrCDS7949 [Dimorphilus gyrociliatus]|uniref:DgyrCDS7949 n=1 Tax=Dimorphilus gyrociliatus TaxID=2664684 RepID=A0A7I8VV42_9ANNE|nr:DgyrCDS7949 [Dimorphilus gyrociliatus]
MKIYYDTKIIIIEPDPPPSYGSTPPAYDATYNDPPPSYDTIFGRMKEARNQSTSTLQYAKKFFQIIVSTVAFTLMLLVLLAIPISMIVIGSIYKGDCPREKYIPIYLIVAGAFGVLKNISSLFQRCKNRNEENAEEANSKTNPFDSLIGCFLFGWFVAGNVWIYKIYDDFDDKNKESADYCNPTLYYFSFWITTAVYIFALCMCCSMCIIGVCGAIMGNRDNNNQSPHSEEP